MRARSGDGEGTALPSDPAARHTLTAIARRRRPASWGELPPVRFDLVRASHDAGADRRLPPSRPLLLPRHAADVLGRQTNGARPRCLRIGAE